MMRRFIRWLFDSKPVSSDTMEALRKNPYFRSVEELQNREAQIENTTKLHLASGAIETIYIPDLGFNRGYRLSEWHVQMGQLIKTGDVICSLETDEIVFEFESLYNGRIISMCALNQKLKVGDEIFKMEGI